MKNEMIMSQRGVRVNPPPLDPPLAHLENRAVIGFLRNTVPDHLENHAVISRFPKEY